MGVFYRPAEVFDNLHLHPRCLAGLLVLATVVVAYDLVVMQRTTTDQSLVAGLGSSAQLILGPTLHIGTVGILLLILAAILMVLGRGFGGRISYKQAFCVAVFSSLPPAVLERAISVILLYANPKGSFSLLEAINGVAPLDLRFLISKEERPLMHMAAGCLSLIWLYRARLQATGLRYAGERITSVKSWMIAVLLWIGGALAAVTAKGLLISQ